jgi:hypothetical protein
MMMVDAKEKQYQRRKKDWTGCAYSVIFNVYKNERIYFKTDLNILFKYQVLHLEKFI